MDIVKEAIIWYPADYIGRTTEEYQYKVAYMARPFIEALVMKRAEEDGKWAIANGLVGENNKNEAKMRRMMEFVSDEENIRQCLAHIHQEGLEHERTVDWVCRDLANASKVMIR